MGPGAADRARSGGKGDVVNSFFESMSNAEITLLAAIVSALIAAAISILTTRYTIKHGPNYKEQIEGLRGTIGALAQTQEDLRKQQAEQAQRETERYEAQEKKADAQRWKPTAKIECSVDGNKYVNKLILKSVDSFRILEVGLLGPTGAKLYDLPQRDSWVSSNGFAVTITQDSLLELVRISSTFFTEDTFDGSVQYRVQRDGNDHTEFIGTTPIHGKQVLVENIGSFKLSC